MAWTRPSDQCDKTHQSSGHSTACRTAGPGSKDSPVCFQPQTGSETQGLKG